VSLYGVFGESRAGGAEPEEEQVMALDFATVRFLRILFAIVVGLVGAGAGMRYLPSLSVISIVGGFLLGALVGWNLVDLFKGRAQK
jgi:nucleoside recognition membrane protein YjiH